MNYLTEIVAFHHWLETNQCDAIEQALWHHLMSINNQCGWSVWFTVANMTLQAKLNGIDRKTLADRRNKLCQKGRLEYVSQGKKKAGRYRLIAFEGEIAGTVPVETALTVPKPSLIAATLNKQNKTKKPAAKPIAKINYADHVMLAEAEYQKLVDEHGEQDARRMIEILNNYKGSTGKTYKSDYLAILNWVVNRLGEEKARAGFNKSPPEKVLCNGDEILW